MPAEVGVLGEGGKDVHQGSETAGAARLTVAEGGVLMVGSGRVEPVVGRVSKEGFLHQVEDP